MKVLLTLIMLLLFTQGKKLVAVQPEKFKVGFILPLTGNAADYGNAIKNSVKLAQIDNPQSFSHVEFLYEDVSFDTKQAVSAFHKLSRHVRVNLIVTWGVPFCQALSALADSYGVATVGLCIDQESSVGKTKFIRFMNSDHEFMSVLADHLESNGIKQVGILLTEHSYTEGLFAALKSKSLGSTLHVETIGRVPLTEMSFLTYLLKARSQKYDAIGAFVLWAQIPQFAKEYRQLGFTLPIIGTNLFEGSFVFDSVKGAIEGAVFPNLSIKQNFMERYSKEFHNQMQLTFGAPAYELARALGKFFNTTDSHKLSASEIIRTFSTLKDEPGVAAGPYSYINTPTSGGYIKFPIVMKQVRAGIFVE